MLLFACVCQFINCFYVQCPQTERKILAEVNISCLHPFALFTQGKHGCRSSGSCVCTPFEVCYRRHQVLYLDNCWLVRGAGHHVLVDLVILNHAGLPTTRVVHVRSRSLDRSWWRRVSGVFVSCQHLKLK